MPAVNRTEKKKNIKAASSVERVVAHLRETPAGDAGETMVTMGTE